MVSTKQVRLGSQASKQVKELYYRAFPAYERLPYYLLLLGAYRPKTQFLAYYNDKGEFCGLSYSVANDDTFYILFLAVSEAKRSQGIGSQILADLRRRAGHRTLVLTIEPLDEKAENYPERLKRLAFYEKNGYQLTTYTYYEGKETYTVLSSNPSFNPAKLETLFKQAIFYSMSVRLEKRS